MKKVEKLYKMPPYINRREFIGSSASFSLFLFAFSYFGLATPSGAKNFGKTLKVTPKLGSRGAPNTEWWKKVKEKDLRYIKQIRYSSGNNSTRVVIDLERRAEYKSNLLKDGRFYIDLDKTVLHPPKQNFTINTPTVKAIRVSQFDTEKVRIVLDLVDSNSSVNVFPLPDPKNERLVLDVFLPSSPIQKQPLVKTYPGKTIESPALSKVLGTKIKRVLIDPGHGGKDPGALRGRTKEKNIVLTVSKELTKILKKKTTLDVRMTREKDIFIQLEERMAMARNQGADLFISVHANACPKTNRRGIETYYLSLTTDPEAMQTAERENAWAGLARHEIRQSLTNILTKNSKIEDSRTFAGTIQRNLIKHTKQINRGVRKAPFVVLIGADMPSVLAEIGYISNKSDRRLLTKKSHQKKIAQALANGIIEYTETYSHKVRK